MLRGIKRFMSEQQYMTPGIEVCEHRLNKREQGFLAGVFEAWANQTLTESDFRDAMTLLIAGGSELEN
jgi:hypothetical protein